MDGLRLAEMAAKISVAALIAILVFAVVDGIYFAATCKKALDLGKGKPMICLEQR